MEKTQTFRVKMQRFSGAIQSNKYMSAISNGLMLSMSVLIAGALFSLLDSINISAYQNFLTNTGLKTLTGIPATITTNLISLYAVFGIAYSLAGKFKQDGFSAAILALMSFLILTPMMTIGEGYTAITSLPVTWLGAPGLFVAMIVGVVVSRLYVLIIEKKFYIKMPKGVPPTVEKTFSAIVPCIIITVVMLAIRGIFANTSFGNAHQFIYTFLQIPLTKLGGSWIAFLICTLAGSVLWFLGVHGTMVVYGVMAPIWTTLGLENLTAFQKGLELPHLVPGGAFLSIFATLGGSGATIGLAISLLFAKSKHYKTLGKLVILPSFLGINEPLMFGLPIVLNTKFIIPLVIAPLANVIIAIVATSVGLIPRLRSIGTPLGTPIGVNGFIEGGWRVAMLQIILIGLSFLIYYPFFKKADSAAYEEEIKGEVVA
ncbi:PTS transporter subunit EIIC [Clostridium intestinale]|uniref:PTS sugar transporter subunit IIC n=1 Tax=Clostridium intestinale TaxID=36845 RepID=UPI0028E510A8|nr:PTS transporter subunit EIIC [Clostridium intestinale]